MSSAGVSVFTIVSRYLINLSYLINTHISIYNPINVDENIVMAFLRLVPSTKY